MSKVISLDNHRRMQSSKIEGVHDGGVYKLSASPVPMSSETKTALTDMMFEALACITKIPRSEEELALLNKKQELQIRNREKL